MKMLKSKNIRRICVLLAMLAPAVYLFGSLFAGLTGAHGQEVFAEPVYVDQWIETDVYDRNGSYKIVIGSDLSDFLRSAPSGPSVPVEGVYFNGYTVTSYTIYNYENGRYFGVYGYEGATYLCSYNFTTGVYSENRSRPWELTGNISVFYSLFSTYGAPFILYKSVPVPSDVVVESPGAYSDYVFKNFFAKDNFLEQIGKDVLSDNPHGFVPFASFWKYLDENMLHMGDMQLGLMGYGYVYYCCHVLLFDIAFILVTFFLDFIQKVHDKVVGGVD